MYPIGSNGASQAILDGRALADALALACAASPTNGPETVGQDRSPGILAVRRELAANQADRLPKTARIVVANRGQGPDHAMQIVEERAPGGFAHVHDVATPDELEAIAAAYKALVGLEIETVNAKMKAWRAQH
jgi:hypothetical protein